MVRNKILESLRSNDGFVSGQELSSKLNISRTAIWKHVNILKKEGYVIDASPRKGYLLKRIPDLLLPQEIERLLTNKSIGKKVVHFDSVCSTINIARDLSNAGGDGTVIIAEKQTEGCGRFGRGWSSPKGGVWLSILIRPLLDPVEAPKLTVVASLTIIEALRNIGVNAEVKWPNDILVEDKKIAGVLLEMSSDLDKINHVIISMGVNINNNLNSMPKDLHSKVTTAKEVLGKKASRLQFTIDLLERLEHNYSKLFDNHFDSLLKEWKSLCVTIGKPLSIKTISGKHVGKALNIDEYGRLLVLTDKGEKKLFSSGEATILK